MCGCEPASVTFLDLRGCEEAIMVDFCEGELASWLEEEM